MPLYIVRWVNLTASLVQADDEDHLQYMLDEAGDVGAAIWEEYNGPVWIEFQPDFRRTEGDKFELVNDFDSDSEVWDFFRAGVADAETSSDMFWTVAKRLFPHIYVALRKTAGSDLTDEQVRATINAAIAREGWHKLAYKERSRRTDETGTIMGMSGVSVITESFKSSIANGLEQAKQAGQYVEDQLMAMAAQQRDDADWFEAQYDRLQAERERAFEDFRDDEDDFDDEDDVDDEDDFDDAN